MNQLLAHVVREPAAPLRVVDRQADRQVEVTVSGRPGETAWVVADVAAGTTTTRTYTPPP